MRDEISAHPEEKLKFGILRDDKPMVVEATPEKTVVRDVLDLSAQTIGRVGFTPDLEPPVIGLTTIKGLAAQYGLMTFDEVTSVNGKAVRSYPELEYAIRHHSGDTLKLVALRPQKLDVS